MEAPPTLAGFRGSAVCEQFVQAFWLLHDLRMKVALDSPFKVGLAYEKLTVEVLKRYGFHLKHTGRGGDGGQDFTGHWMLPRRTLPVVGEARETSPFPSLCIQLENSCKTLDQCQPQHCKA